MCGLLILASLLSSTPSHAGGPRYVAGLTFFNPGVLGQPVHWAGGQVSYYVDQGPLNATIDNQQATAMVDAAAALWSAVPTAGVNLVDAGRLSEDVSGTNIVATASGAIAAPADVAPSAIAYPVGVIYDADGSVIDALFGANASLPESCQNNGVFVWIDNIDPDATIVHAVILLNGLCATDSGQMAMMAFEVARAFGRVLGLDYSQVNPNALVENLPNGSAGWPVMQPLVGVCTQDASCVSDPAALRYDDIATLNRIYPITAQNLAGFPGKQITAAQTVSIQGNVLFRSGYGMQGVNVVARPLDASGNPLYQYTVTFVSGAYFGANHGNPVTGYTDDSGTPLSQWGSNDAAQQGFFDLSYMPLPPGVTAADYEITLEAIDPSYILDASVGPYTLGQVSPSGTLPRLTLTGLAAGSAQTVNFTLADSASGGYQDAIGAATAPRPMPGSGLWVGRLSQVGQTDWFSFPVRGNRTFTAVTQALDESGRPTALKAMPAIGAWDAFDPVTASAARATPALNGQATGETWLRVSTVSDGLVRLGIADQRGDGRPDYAYAGFLLYADTVEPAHLPVSGGPIVIHGMGFHASDTVLVGGQPAAVTSVSPNEITAIAPPAATAVMGVVDVEIDDRPSFYAAAIVSGALSYDSGAGDALTLVTAPQNIVPVGVPIPFSVVALGPDLSPAGGVTVTYRVAFGTATLACGLPVCVVVASGDGRASIAVTAVDGTASEVTASLSNGSSLQAQFSGGTAPVISALAPRLSVAAGATLTWTVQALVLSNGQPSPNQAVFWQSGSAGLAAQSSAGAITGASGVATTQLTVGPLMEGQIATINACLNGTSQCVTYTALGARPELASLEPVSGTAQSVSVSATPAQVALRLLDTDGNPMAGGTVVLYQALYAWAPPCAAQGPCPLSNLLATQAATAISALDGTVTFIPATLPGVATTLQALAATGNTSSVPIVIEQHP